MKMRLGMRPPGRTLKISPPCSEKILCRRFFTGGSMGDCASMGPHVRDRCRSGAVPPPEIVGKPDIRA